MADYRILYDGYPDPTEFASFKDAESYIFKLLEREDLDSWRKTGRRVKWHTKFPSDGGHTILYTKFHDERHEIIVQQQCKDCGVYISRQLKIGLCEHCTPTGDDDLPKRGKYLRKPAPDDVK